MRNINQSFTLHQFLNKSCQKSNIFALQLHLGIFKVQEMKRILNLLKVVILFCFCVVFVFVVLFFILVFFKAQIKDISLHLTHFLTLAILKKREKILDSIY